MAVASMRELTPGWKATAVVAEGQPVDLAGQNVWNSNWNRSGEPVVVPHPGHLAQRHTAIQYVMSTPAGEVRFAACELSANCWGFYEPDSSAALTPRS